MAPAAQHAKDAAEVPPLEQLGGNGPEDRGEPVPEDALEGHHEIEQPGRRAGAQGKEQEVTGRESHTRQGPHPLAADPIGEDTEPDLTRDPRQAHGPQRPGGHRGSKADLDQVLRLVDFR